MTIRARRTVVGLVLRSAAVEIGHSHHMTRQFDILVNNKLVGVFLLVGENVQELLANRPVKRFAPSNASKASPASRR